MQRRERADLHRSAPFLFGFFEAAPDAGGEERGRIASGDNTDQHRQCKVYNRGQSLHIAEDQYQQNCSRGHQGCIDGTGQGLLDTCVDQVYNRKFIATQPLIFADAVKDHQSIIYRVTKDGKHYGDKAIVDGNTEKYKYKED